MKSIFETAEGFGSLATFVRAVRAAGMEDLLRTEGPFTVFIPTDQAFGDMPEGLAEDIMADREKSAEFVAYHAILDKMTSYELGRTESVKTQQGDYVDISATGADLFVNGVLILQTDIECTNGIFHIIDAVLMPRALAARL
jgi:uncharacterized surface protein with fasciclin (FAS1) repeats